MERTILMVAAITKNNGTLYKYDELMNKYRLQIRFMDYACLINGILRMWKELLKEHPVSKYSLHVENEPAFNIDCKCIKLKNAKCKEL